MRPRASTRHAAPQSVDRIFAILTHLACERSGDSLAGIARKTRAPKTSIVGLLAGMIESGYLERDADGRYRLGTRMLSLAMRVLSGTNLAALGRPVLAWLAEETGETAILGTMAPDADTCIYIDKVESTSPLRFTVSLGERRELYCSAMGKLLLAHMEKPRQERYLRTEPLRAFTPDTITSVRRLRGELDRALREGIARTHSERVAGVSALAAPVFGPNGALQAVVSLGGPSNRIRANSVRLELHLREAAKRLTQLVSEQSAVIAQ